MKIISEIPHEVGRLDMQLVRPRLSTILRFLNVHHLGGFEDGEQIGDLSIADHELSFIGLGGSLAEFKELDNVHFRADLQIFREAISEVLEITRSSINFGQDDPNTPLDLKVNLPENSDSLAGLFHIDQPGLVATWQLSEHDEYTPTEFLVGAIPFDEDRAIRQRQHDFSIAFRKWIESGYDPNLKPKKESVSEAEIYRNFNAGLNISRYQIVPSSEGAIYRLGDRTLGIIAPELDEIRANVHRRAKRKPGFRFTLGAEFKSIPEVSKYLI